MLRVTVTSDIQVREVSVYHVLPRCIRAVTIHRNTISSGDEKKKMGSLLSERVDGAEDAQKVVRLVTKIRLP